MKKIIIIIVIFLLSASITFAGIGENFEKGGIGLAGSIRLYFNLYYFLDDYDDRLAFSIDLFPELHFFVKDNLSILFGPFFTYENDSDGDGFGSSYISFGGLFGLEYAFVSNPDAERGRVTALGVTLQPTLIKSESDYLWVYIYLNPVLKLYYFVNDAVAPFISFKPSFLYLLATDSMQMNDAELSDRLRLRFTILLGISYHIPSQKASILFNRIK